MNGQHRLVDGNGFRGVEDRDEPCLLVTTEKVSGWSQSGALAER